VKLIAAAAGLVWLASVATVSLSAAATSLPSATLRYADGAPPGFSGAFGENSCHACHFEGDLNTKPGHVTIDGVPDRFVAGTSYPLTVTLQRPGMTTGGFQLTARFRDGGAQAGSLAVAPDEVERLKVDVKGDVVYANQRTAGSTLDSPGRAIWTIRWTAPADGGVVRFDVAANAGNKDDSASGDYVFTVVRESEPARR
jgi:hypothetical protein